MKRYKHFILLMALLPLHLFSQNQEIKGTLTVESTTSIGQDIVGKWGEGARLYLRGTDRSTDPIWLVKHTSQKDQTDLRINIGDGKVSNDRLVIGTTPWDTGQWTEVLALSMNGCINVNSANSKLNINGTIRAKEVKIEATGWADFVFKPEYKLTSLSEVESHILEYGHLPDIPSENEVKENGIDVGEIQVKMLQKIEELTLYVIEQDKKIAKQNSEILGQQKEIENLKNK